MPGLVGNEQHGGEREDEEGEPGGHAFSLSLPRVLHAGRQRRHDGAAFDMAHAAQLAISAMRAPAAEARPVALSSRQILTQGVSKEGLARLMVPSLNVGAAGPAGQCARA